MAFDFGNVNEEKRDAITTVDGPVLITAGPGTGKTLTLVMRTLYLIQEKHVKPENILVATFTEKAAKELITRITNTLAERNITVNLNDMYIGTFHQICLRILSDHLEYTRLKKNYKLLDAFDQQYTVMENLYRFSRIPGYNNPELGIMGLKKKKTQWKQAGAICGLVNNMTEEMVDTNAMRRDRDPAIVALANIVDTYRSLLEEGNYLDFSSIQTECYRLLKEHPDILAQIQDQIQYLMIDEYQDTNYIQEQLVFLLAGKRQNICVVGDDDQGMYRFRGATIRNILEFPYKFPQGLCHRVHLVTNYRSDPSIIRFYNKWMNTPQGFSWTSEDGMRQYRFPKEIKPAPDRTTVKSPAVAKLIPHPWETWNDSILNLIKRLKASGKVTNYNQIALLSYSVKDDRTMQLAAFLEAHGVRVYSPRSNMFFRRKEIRLALGCLMLMFSEYVKGLGTHIRNKRDPKTFKKLKTYYNDYNNPEPDPYQYLNAEVVKCYWSCIQIASQCTKAPAYKELASFVWGFARKHKQLRLLGQEAIQEAAGDDYSQKRTTTDYAYTALLYRLFQFEPFKSILDNDLKSGVADTRPVRNLAALTQMIGKFEELYNIHVLSAKRIQQDTLNLFNRFMRLLVAEGAQEYEDESEYAPSGCVSFLTIHQAKGMEFPIVICVTPDGGAWYNRKVGIQQKIQHTYFQKSRQEDYEPYADLVFFDYWRRYYTAFSRAEGLLVLTNPREPDFKSKNPFYEIYRELPEALDLDFSAFDFQQVKPVDLKEMFSFTSDVTVYETCPRQYKFYRELGFMPVRQGASLFGLVVHETIEDIHRAAMRGEENTINGENIQRWFAINYNSLVQRTRSYLAPAQRQGALEQVLRYAERESGHWDRIRDAEVDVSLVRPTYILDGRIDLVRGEGNTVELVDFKSEPKPDVNNPPEKLRQYMRQLQIYAFLVEQRTGHKVSRMNLYYTAEENGNPVISWPYEEKAVNRTIDGFDRTVGNILAKDYDHGAGEQRTCDNCDFRFYCGKNRS